MSRLESELTKRFEIAKEEAPEHKGLVAMPLNLRKQTIENFDREFRISDAKAADAHFESEKQKSPELAEYLTNAKLLERENEFELAKNLYQNVLRLDAKNELAIRGAADCASALNQHEEALEILFKLVTQFKTPHNYKLLGDQLYKMQYNEDALDAYFRALKLSMADGEQLFEIYKNMGNIFLRIGDTAAAEEYYNKAYTIHPDSDVLLVNYGSLAVYKGDFEKALVRFREAVNVNDLNDKAWVGLAMIHREYGDNELAWANVEKALDINFANESAVKLVSEWALKDNEIDKAIARLSNYLKSNDSDALIRMWLAKFLYFSGRLENAAAEIARALKQNPNLEGGAEVYSVIQQDLQALKERIK
jgi:tetratricopeptide (TPR) repeat protein